MQSQMTVSDSIGKQLAASRAVINSTRNMSPTFAPISILPAELFSRIFMFTIASTSPNLRCDEPDPLLAISAVCTGWRQLAIGTRSLWSHIDLYGPPSTGNGSSDPTGATQLWLERSHGAPLHLHVHFESCDDQRFMTNLLLKLQPHLTYLSSLVFRGAIEEILDQFFSLCCRCGVPGSLKTLIVVSGWYGGQTRQRWPTTYLRGLVDLQLSELSSSVTPSFQELFAILSGSPALVTLRLRDVSRLFPGQALAVSLPKLQLLDIIHLDHTSLLGLLNALSPGGLELDFRFSFGQLTNRDVTEVIVPFCRRSNIVSLYLSGTNHGPDVRVSSLLQCLPSIRVLVLDNKHDDFHAVNMADVNSGKSTAWCPALHTLCLKGSNGLNEDAQEQVEEILEIYSLRTIMLEGFGLASHDGDSQSEEDTRWEQRNADFLNNLSRKVESVIVDNGLLDGENEEVDLHIRKLIDASKGASERM